MESEHRRDFGAHTPRTVLHPAITWTANASNSPHPAIAYKKLSRPMKGS
jgi:hypothetical protein